MAGRWPSADARRSPAPAKERFQARVGPMNDRGCLPWQGAVVGSGYGSFYWREEHKVVLAHRFSHMLAKGPIPVGMEIDHLCLNKLCVNPDHFEVVTPLINRRRGNAKLNVSAVIDIRSSSASFSALAKKYAVSKGAISSVRSGRTWGDVDAEAKVPA